MSQETYNWLNNYTLIGFTEKRGNAWHFRIDEQGDEPNHYPGAIPVDDVLRRLFNFEVFEAGSWFFVTSDRVPENIDSLGIPYVKTEGGIFVPSQNKRKGMLTSDNLFDLGAFKEGYQGHQYKEWLLDTVANLLDDELSIGSAGLLKNRGQAWVSVEVPDSITTPEGVVFRPNLLATTSFDGTLATTFKRVFQIVVCDNTREIALSEDGEQMKVKHSKYSNFKLNDARQALAIVHKMADEFSAEVARLCSWKVSDRQFNKLLDIQLPLPAKKEDEGARNNGLTIITKKREDIMALYNNDERAAQWNGTAYGVIQAFNTWNHHFARVNKGTPRIIRNMENVVKGKYADMDNELIQNLTLATK